MTGGPTITYFCPVAENRPIGGVKVIHKHAEILAGAGIDAQVFQPTDINAVPRWFDSRAPMKRENTFERTKDFLVIPETQAFEYAKQFYQQGFKYAIFVQGGYNTCFAPEGYPLAKMRLAYENASLILSISDDTSAMIALMYPAVANKIVRVLPHIGDMFAPGAKARTIAYMPRKMAEHSRLVRSYFEINGAPGWDFTPIQNLNEAGVASVLATTSIFLAFSDLEGFSLPPVEAALSGALVVGYTGQGGLEYFQPPNFRRVETSNIRAFIAETQKAIDSVNAGLLESAAFREGTAQLAARYSRDNERRHLIGFAERVQALFQA